MHVGIAQSHQHAAAARPRARTRVLRERNACASCCSNARALPARIAPLRFTPPCSSSSRWVIESGTSGAVRGEHPGHRRARRAIQPAQEPRVIARVEAIGDFVEQQQFRPAGECARDEHQAALAIRKREEAALGELADVEAAQQRAPRVVFGGRELAHREYPCAARRCRPLRARGNSSRSVRSGPGARRRRRRFLRATPAGMSKFSPRQR